VVLKWENAGYETRTEIDVKLSSVEIKLEKSHHLIRADQSCAAERVTKTIFPNFFRARVPVILRLWLRIQALFPP
jgi:hypothetical protein